MYAGTPGGSQTVTAAVALSASSPQLTIYNSASAITQALPTTGLVDGQKHMLKCMGAGGLSVTGNIDTVAATTATIAQFAGNTFVYSVALATWAKF
ncbi:hypothetical protein [Paraburkholderia elongata]|uniref:Uncharacterized protein n=1 Tax=Paraburkholderia elongata TaxID=2675747 RepID=A0A972NSV9_9BURK|nr:hypothetical protein [Paraburkholderia elongata]NPT59091.1 hypothetical protein [Paraburkholderia elongata]